MSTLFFFSRVKTDDTMLKLYYNVVLGSQVSFFFFLLFYLSGLLIT